MYPPSTRTEETAEIPIAIAELEKEYLFPNSDNCTILKAYRNKMMDSDHWKQYEDTYMRAKKQLLAAYPAEQSIPPLRTYFDALMCRKSHGIPMPNGLPHSVLSDCLDAVSVEMTLQYADREVSSLSSGLLIRDIHDRMMASSKNESELRFALYSVRISAISFPSNLCCFPPHSYVCRSFPSVGPRHHSRCIVERVTSV